MLKIATIRLARRLGNRFHIQICIISSNTCNNDVVHKIQTDSYIMCFDQDDSVLSQTCLSHLVHKVD